MKKIAVTGGIGSGKSSVIKRIAELGFPIFSCDEINKNLLQDKVYIQQLGEIFPDVVENGAINKSVLRKIVFQDEEKRKLLNKIAHPIIMERLIEAMENSNAGITFAEVPLLYEENYEDLFDQIIVVYRDVEDRISSICKRDQISEGDAKLSIRVQFDYDSIENQVRLKKDNTWVICNNGSISLLNDKVDALLKEIGVC